jgi:Tfp pilus assembly protein PilV
MRFDMIPKRHRRQGVIILDVLAAVFVLAIGAAAVFGLIPVVQKSQRAANDENKAVQMGNRMIEHLHLLPARDLTVSNLQGLNLLDGEQTGSPYSFTNVPMDDASGYSPAQVLKNASATLEIDDIDSGSKRATIVIAWTSASGKSKSLTMGTIVGGYR